MRAHLNQADVTIESIVFPENLAFALQTIELFEAYRAEEVGDGQAFITQGFQFGLPDRIEGHASHRLVLQKGRLTLEIAEHRSKKIATHPEAFCNFIPLGVPEIGSGKATLDQKYFVGNLLGLDNDFALVKFNPLGDGEEPFKIGRSYLKLFKSRVFNSSRIVCIFLLY